MKLWQQTRKHLAGFSGRTKEIDGRQYLRFTEYLKWRGRRNKGDFGTGLHTGLAVSQWNRWVEAQGGESVATLPGVKVGMLNRYLDGYRYRVCRNAGELAEEVSQRESLLGSLQIGIPDGSHDELFRHRVERWKGLALGFLPEIYALREASDLINRRYIDGHDLLFPSAEEGFDVLLALVEKTGDIYNDTLAEDIERLENLLGRQIETPLTIDLAGLVEAVRGAASEQVAYLVDMAKADALDLLGETSQALELVDRHV